MNHYHRNRLISLLCFCSALLITVHTGAQMPLDSLYSYDALNDTLQRARNDKDIATLAITYRRLADFESEINSNQIQAFDYYTRAIEYYRILGQEDRINEIRFIIANRYVDAELYAEAIDQYEELLQYYRNNGNTYMQTHLLAKLADVYNITGDIDKEYEYLNIAIDLNRELKDSTLMIDFLMKKVRNYLVLSEPDSALLLSVNAVRIADQIGDLQRLSAGLTQVGEINKSAGDFEKAQKYYSDAEQILPMKPYSKPRRNIYLALSELHDTLQNSKVAYQYAMKYALLNDSILNEDKVQAEYKMALRFETNEKQKDIVNLEQEKKFAAEKNIQQRRALYLLSGGLALLLALLYFLVRFYTQKIRTDNIITQQEKELRLQKIQTLENDMQMKGMESMIAGQEMERERIAKDLHDSLGGLLSTIKLQFDSVQAHDENVAQLKSYKNANKLLDSAVEEVRSISRNLQPGALAELGLEPALKDLINNFDGDNYPEIDLQVYDLPKDMNNILALSIFRVIQELLYNSIKHAKANEILIQINRKDDELVIQFEDDGIGYDPDNLKRKGMGLENIKSRIGFLKGTLSVDTRPGAGLSVLIHVNYK